MNEKEKMINGYLYDSTVEDLTADRVRAKKLCREFNNLEVDDFENRSRVIAELFSKVGKNYHIEPNFFCDYGYNIEIGENFYVNHNCVILDCAKVSFGDNVFIAPNCGFYTGTHPLNYKVRNELLEFALPIEVGNNVWIGANVVVLPDVKIGDNSVIGAGSVVTKNIPPNSLAYGNPCKVVKVLTGDEAEKYKV